MASIFLRSLVFNILFYLVFLFWAVVALPTFVMPRAALLRVESWWARSNIFLMRVICNIKVEFRGVEKIPKGPLIVASKHQSMWETISLPMFFEAPFFALKRELLDRGMSADEIATIIRAAPPKSLPRGWTNK